MGRAICLDPEEIFQMLENKVTPVEVYGSANGAVTPPLPKTATDIPLEVAENSIKGSVDQGGRIKTIRYFGGIDSITSGRNNRLQPND